MSHLLIVRPEAEADIAAAQQWYEGRRRGLGLEFRSALDDTVSSIAANPKLYASVYRSLRRALLRRFPYGVFYLVQPETVIVVGVLHTSRSPRLWRARFKGRG